MVPPIRDSSQPSLRLTERRNPRTADIDRATPQEIVDLIGAEDAAVAGAVARARVEIARAMELVESSLRRGGRLLYVGAGTSGRLGVLDAAECPPTFGTPPELVVGIIAGGSDALVRSIEGAEDDPDEGARAMDRNRVGPNDTVVGIASSGTTPYVRGALTRAGQLGAKTVFLTCVDPPADPADRCDVTIAALTGPEVVTGSTRMKAGTATKLILNTLTTGVMIRLGKTYGNLMVDLQAWNEKLVDRGERILMAVTGADREAARVAIQSAGGSVRTAIVMVKRGSSRADAEALLRTHDNHLRPILGDPPPVGPE
jgi:N-acetylmuramic acid 6-phosphate etherase